jgi:hypothetical protein
MTQPDRPWPPLIVAQQVPAAVRWRDALLTLLMWAVVAGLLAGELGLIWREHLQRPGFDPGAIGRGRTFAIRLIPFLALAAMLSTALAAFAVRTLRRGRRALVLPPPTPLGDADQARRAGLDAAELLAAREQPIVVVHAEPDGRLQLEPRPPP